MYPKRPQRPPNWSKRISNFKRAAYPASPGPGLLGRKKGRKRKDEGRRRKKAKGGRRKEEGRKEGRKEDVRTIETFNGIVTSFGGYDEVNFFEE